MEIIIAKNEPNLKPVPAAREEQIVEAAIKIQSAIAGEKSKAENLKNENLLKIFRYGSQILEIARPNFEYCAPGNQLSMTRIKHKSV